MKSQANELLPDDARDFLEDYAYSWAAIGNPRVDGRVLGLLLITDQPYLSLAQIAAQLCASTGAISTSTRRLATLGFLRPHSIPGDRNHYFRTDEDVWGSFLAGERNGFTRLAKSIDSGLDVVPEGPSRARTRLRTARHYMDWIMSYHRKMLADWEEYRDTQLDQSNTDGPPP